MPQGSHAGQMTTCGSRFFLISIKVPVRGFRSSDLMAKPLDLLSNLTVALLLFVATICPIHLLHWYILRTPVIRLHQIIQSNLPVSKFLTLNTPEEFLLLNETAIINSEEGVQVLGGRHYSVGHSKPLSMALFLK